MEKTAQGTKKTAKVEFNSKKMAAEGYEPMDTDGSPSNQFRPNGDGDGVKLFTNMYFYQKKSLIQIISNCTHFLFADDKWA